MCLESLPVEPFGADTYPEVVAQRWGVFRPGVMGTIRMMFLNLNELEEITGYKRPNAMRRWLGENGFNYAIAADGYPRVLRAAVTKRLGGDESSDEWQPPMLRKH